jgi:hypothetical protein
MGRRIRQKEDLDPSIKEIDTKRRRLMIERVELWGSMLAPHSREHFNNNT